MFKYSANVETPSFEGNFKQNTSNYSAYSPYYKSNSNYPRYSSNNRTHNILKKQYPTSSIVERQSILDDQVVINTRQRSVTPQNRRFKYSQNILDACKESTDKKSRSKQYKYDIKAGNKLDNMPQMAKQIYCRIKPKKHYSNQQEENYNELLTLGKQDNYSTNKSFTTFSKPLKQRDFQQIYKAQHDSQIEKLTRHSNKYELQQKSSIDQNQINPPKYNIQNLRNIENCSRLSHKDRSSLSPYKKMNNVLKKYERPKRLDLQSKNYEYERSNQQNKSPINYLSNQRHDEIDEQGINFKPYEHIIKQPSYLEKTIGSNYSLKQAKATDDSNFKQFNQSQTLNLKNKQTKRMVNNKSKEYIDSMFESENKSVTYQKTRVSFSRQLNEYEDEALKKIQTINELNNKIGQRIKNILNNIS